ncbi:Uncharacterised protein [Chlamydia trachomatis]|nr:Uncharacterised protein [Chlamydia trachomatis]
MSTFVAPSLMASAVSATLTSRNVCEEGNAPETTAMSTPSTSRVSFTTSAKLGYTQMVATWGRSGYAVSNWLTFSTMAMMFTSLSDALSEVSSTLPKRNFLTSAVSFSGTFSTMIFFNALPISASSTSQLYFSSACSYLLFFCVSSARLAFT